MTEIIASRTQPDPPEFPLDRECPYRPSAEYDNLRDRGPVGRVRLFDGTLAWVVTDHADARALLAHPGISSNRSHPNFPVPFRPWPPCCADGEKTPPATPSPH